MSTDPRHTVNSPRDIEGALTPHITVDEKETHKINEYPPDIHEQLKRAAFEEKSESVGTFVKEANPANSDDDTSVVTVKIGDDGLEITAEDIVGVVNLTPNTVLQINPIIGWEEILQMFLEVSDRRRSLDYRGVPIREFLADDIGIKDIFIVVAINYLDSLEDIFRRGFIRSFSRERVKGLQERGQIDIEASIKNFHLSTDVPQHEFVQKNINYGTPVNDVIYRAGSELRDLFQLYASVRDTDEHTRVFSQLERVLSRLESRGITGDSITLRDIPSITSDQIPQQRGYYQKALQISKTVLSSTIGQPLDEGREQLLMEYIISMNSLFESYTQLSIEKEIEELQEDLTTGGFEGMNVSKKSYQLFEGNIDRRIEPDHVITSDDSPIAVLDSKYYRPSSDLLKGGRARSQLLSYGFQLQTDQLGIVAPLATPQTHEFKHRPGRIHIISPEKSEFTTEGLRQAIRKFLIEEFGESASLGISRIISEYRICHPGVTAESVDECLSKSALTPDSLSDSGIAVLRYTISERLSDEASPHGTPYIGPHRKFEQYVEDKLSGYDIVVPVFISSSDSRMEEVQSRDSVTDGSKDPDEYIEAHCFSTDYDGKIIDYEKPQPFPISW